MTNKPSGVILWLIGALLIALWLTSRVLWAATDLSDKTWTDRCDVVEFNHFGSEYQQKQIIFWTGEYGQRVVKDWRWWPKDCNGVVMIEPSPVVRWTDERGVRRCVVGKIHIETWDTVDREVENQKILPGHYRVKLREPK